MPLQQVSHLGMVACPTDKGLQCAGPGAQGEGIAGSPRRSPDQGRQIRKSFLGLCGKPSDMAGFVACDAGRS